jgi:hypothetical protein
MDKIIKKLKNLIVFGGGVIAHHYGSKLLDRESDLEAERMQSVRDSKLDNIDQKIEEVKNLCNKLSEIGGRMDENKVFTPEKIQEMNDRLNEVHDSGNKIVAMIKNNNAFNSEFNEYITKMLKNAEELKKLLDNTDSKNRFNSSLENFTSNIEKFYEYLDTLTLLQESALLHIFIFLALILTVLNILAVLFGNEIINYFNLENKFPSLAIFFKLRLKLKRYYLMWNVFLLFLICIVGIGINILTFIYS